MSNMYRLLLFVAVLLSLTGCQQIMDRLIGTTDAGSPPSTAAADQSNSAASIATATVSTQMLLPAQSKGANIGELLATEEVKVVSVNPEAGPRDLDQSVRKNTRSDQQKNDLENKQQTTPTTSVNTLKKPMIDNVRIYVED